MEWTLEQPQLQTFKQKITNYRRICELIIVLFFIFLYFFLKNAHIPRLDHQFTRYYRQIDWKKYEPDHKKIIKRQEVPAPMNPDANPYSTSPEWDKIVDIDFLNNNISLLINQQPEKSFQTIPDRNPVNETFARIEIDRTDVPNVMDQPKEYFNNNVINILPKNYVNPQNVGPSVAINTNMVNKDNAGKNITYNNSNPVAISSDKIIPEHGIVEIPLISTNKVNQTTDISVILDDLMRWMRKHPYEFNSVMKSFMKFEINDLTSRVFFRHKNRTFELYLLYKEKSKDVHICLIEGIQSTLLIDSGFKKQSNFLRTGNVTRLPDNTIFSFGTSQYPATKETTIEFYQFFLSWWEQAKKEK